MPKLPSGRHVAITAERIADLAHQYEETGEPEEIGRARSSEDLKPFMDVLYFREVKPGGPAHAGLPTGFEPYLSGFTLATIEEEMRSWPEEDREAFNAFLRHPEIVDMLKAALSRALSARVARKLNTGAELTQDDGMTALSAFLLSDKGKRFVEDDHD